MGTALVRGNDAKSLFAFKHPTEAANLTHFLCFANSVSHIYL